jgi:hypothetical protein
MPYTVALPPRCIKSGVFRHGNKIHLNYTSLNEKALETSLSCISTNCDCTSKGRFVVHFSMHYMLHISTLQWNLAIQFGLGTSMIYQMIQRRNGMAQTILVLCPQE